MRKVPILIPSDVAKAQKIQLILPTPTSSIDWK